MSESQSTALQKLENYKVMQFDPDEILETLHANIGEDSISPMDLDRVKIPSGGGKQWEIPGLGEDSDFRKTLSGVIVQWRPQRAYWSVPFEESEGNHVPDCFSDDGKVGIGDPGGECRTCPMNEWGSDLKGGNGKACKEMRLLFVLPEDSLIPIAVILPPTSIGNLKQYFIRLASKGIAYYSVVSSIGLEQTKNDAGIQYSTATFSAEAQLETEAVQFIQNYRETIQDTLASVRMEDDWQEVAETATETE